jgi:hypothetical protein
MRPRGEIFLAVRKALADLRRATWRKLYEALLRMGVQASAKVVRKTVENMVLHGHLVPVADEHVPWSRRPMKVYAEPPPATQAELALTGVMSMWGRAMSPP